MRHDIPGMQALQQKAMAETNSCIPYNPTLRERLIAQKADLTQRLANVNNAIEALDANPTFEQVLDVIGKANY